MINNGKLCKDIYLFIYLLLACKNNGEKNILNLNNYAKFMLIQKLN